ncbi:MAG: energy transducer TonB [Bdellovibrionales bacterium]
MKYKFLAFIGFLALVMISYFSHSPSELEVSYHDIEKIKIKALNEIKEAPPLVKKNTQLSEALRPTSQKFQAQQLSSQMYGSGQGSSGFTAGDQVFNELTEAQEVTTNPRPQSTIQIKYPDFAKQKSLKGFVEIEALISTSGHVENIQILKSEPPGIFDEYVKSEIRKVRFLPALMKGKVVAQKWNQKVRFE